jgi:NADH:ubiquinone oxidoreductase subunit 6 (subunit J)
MKIRKNIYFIIGCILISFSIIADIIDWKNLIDEVKGNGGVGYLIGYHIFFIIGILLISSSFKISKKIKQQEEIEKIDSIGEKKN